MRMKISDISRALQRRPVILHLCGVILVPMGIIFLPVLLYVAFFQTTVPLAIAMKNVPWGPVALVIAIAAILSLLQMPWGVQIQQTETLTNTHQPDMMPESVVSPEKEAIASLKVDIMQSNKDVDDDGMAVTLPGKTL